MKCAEILDGYLLMMYWENYEYAIYDKLLLSIQLKDWGKLWKLSQNFWCRSKSKPYEYESYALPKT
jgi:hypothetical protein